MLDNQRPSKVLPYKTYNSIGHLSGSRLGVSDSRLDAKQDSFMTQKLPDHPKSFLFIEEKLDGSNVCVVRFEGVLRVLSRSGYDCSNSNQEQHRMFYRYVQKHIDKFEQLLPGEHDRVVGEWTALAHGTIYKPFVEPFHAFDIFRNKVQQCVMKRRKDIEDCGLLNVHMGYCGTNPMSIDEALNRVPADSEGVVYRLEKIKKGSSDLKDNTPWIIAKVVRLGKEDGKYLRDGQEIWNWRE